MGIRLLPSPQPSSSTRHRSIGAGDNPNSAARTASLSGWVCWTAGGAQRPAEAAYLAELRQTAARLGIAERVRFLGQRTDVPHLLAAADVHCQPNTGPEPFGLAFVEALAAGRPVVTTALGGALEIVDETCGVHFVEPDYDRDIQNTLTPAYRPTDVYAGVLATALGMIDSGTTGMVDISQISHTPEHSDACIRALSESGIRAVFAYSRGSVPGSRYPQDIMRLKPRYFLFPLWG